MTRDEFLELRKKHSYNNQYEVKNKDELRELIRLAESIDVHMDLNWLDVSSIEDMSYLFKYSKFNGDISKWDVSRVTDMCCMFVNSQFNGDISKWDVSRVTDMCCMFQDSEFNGDISEWDVSNVKDMCCMLENSKFNGDISKWNVSNIADANNFDPYLDINNVEDLKNYISFLRSIYNDKPIEVKAKDGWFRTRNLSVFVANKIRKDPNFLNKIKKALC